MNLLILGDHFCLSKRGNVDLVRTIRAIKFFTLSVFFNNVMNTEKAASVWGLKINNYSCADQSSSVLGAKTAAFMELCDRFSDTGMQGKKS